MPEGLPAAEVDASALLGAAMIHVVRPEVLLEVGQRVQHGAGFQQGDPNPHSGQDVGDRSTARARSDHHHFVLFGGLLDVSHGGIQAQPGEKLNLASQPWRAASEGRTGTRLWQAHSRRSARFRVPAGTIETKRSAAQRTAQASTSKPCQVILAPTASILGQASSCSLETAHVARWASVSNAISISYMVEDS